MQSFRIITPDPLLCPYVRYYWILQDDAVTPVSERTLPVGCIQWVFHKGKQLLNLQEMEWQPSFFVCGQSAGFSDVQSAGRIEMIVVVFQPHAAKVFLQVPAWLFYGQSVDMEDLDDKELLELAKQVSGSPDNDECVRLIERFLFHRLHAFPEYNLRRMSAVLRQIHLCPQIRMTGLSEAACLSDKQFRRVFTDYIGSTPKEFVRLVRMQRALYRLQLDVNIPLAQLAYECGFSDQSHMIKEFRLFSGYTPAEYLRVCMPYSDYFSSL